MVSYDESVVFDIYIHIIVCMEFLVARLLPTHICIIQMFDVQLTIQTSTINNCMTTVYRIPFSHFWRRLVLYFLADVLCQRSDMINDNFQLPEVRMRSDPYLLSALNHRTYSTKNCTCSKLSIAFNPLRARIMAMTRSTVDMTI